MMTEPKFKIQVASYRGRDVLEDIYRYEMVCTKPLPITENCLFWLSPCQEPGLKPTGSASIAAAPIKKWTPVNNASISQGAEAWQPDPFDADLSEEAPQPSMTEKLEGFAWTFNHVCSYYRAMCQANGIIPTETFLRGFLTEFKWNNPEMNAYDMLWDKRAVSDAIDKLLESLCGHTLNPLSQPKQ